MHEKTGCTIVEACKRTGLSRSGYYKRAKENVSRRTQENEQIGQLIEKLHAESPDRGYRRLNDHLRHDHKIYVNDKRVLRICREKGIQSDIKRKRRWYSRRKSPKHHIAENVLNREFHAERPNRKWVSDITELRWYEGSMEHKLYLCAIMDLYDRRIVEYEIQDRNDNILVFKPFDRAVKAHPEAHPLFHSDRGFQYTSTVFRKKLKETGMTQSMSRVGHCTDNGVMEGFWGILKRERYYGRRYSTRRQLERMIKGYIHYYNTKRVQRKLGVMTPMEKYNQYMEAEANSQQE